MNLPRTTSLLVGVSVLAVLAGLGLGCNHNIQIPPARPLSLEGPATVQSGHTRGRIQVAGHGIVFNGDFTSGNVRVRRGLNQRLELAVDGSVISANDSDTTETNMYMGRVGGKLGLGKSENLALTGGVGAGYSPAGGTMASADGGVTLGYNNRYIVPFTAVRTFMSAPINAREVRLGEEPDQVDKATLTGGTGAEFGLSLVRKKFTLAAGIDITVIRDRDDTEAVFSFGAAFEVALD